VDAPSISAFKSRLVYIRDNRMGFFMDCSPLSPRPYWSDDLPVTLHEVNQILSNSDNKYLSVVAAEKTRCIVNEQQETEHTHVAHNRQYNYERTHMVINGLQGKFIFP